FPACFLVGRAVDAPLATVVASQNGGRFEESRGGTWLRLPIVGRCRALPDWARRACAKGRGGGTSAAPAERQRAASAPTPHDAATRTCNRTRKGDVPRRSGPRCRAA